MRNETPTPDRACIEDEPLWRLIVLMHDAERLAGRDAQTVRLLARIIEKKLGDDGEKGASCSKTASINWKPDKSALPL